MKGFTFYEPQTPQYMVSRGDLLVSKNITGRGNYSIVIRLRKELMQRARWMPKDRITLGLSDDGKYGLLRRVKDDGAGWNWARKIPKTEQVTVRFRYVRKPECLKSYSVPQSAIMCRKASKSETRAFCSAFPDGINISALAHEAKKVNKQPFAMDGYAPFRTSLLFTSDIMNMSGGARGRYEIWIKFTLLRARNDNE